MTSVALFDYELPAELIAQEPAPERDGSRAVYAVRGADELEVGGFRELPERLRGDECLVVNDTRVIPARLRARRGSGGAVEVFLLRRDGDSRWHAWISPARRVKDGEELSCDGGSLRVIAREGSFFAVEITDETLIERVGEIPLPPYIERAAGDPRLDALDRERYQTLFARRDGAVAAPTAGLHFSPQLLAELGSRDIPVVPVTLHVGPGTFRPIGVESVEEHRVDPELFEVSAASRSSLAEAVHAGRRLVAVGTTSLRVLESLETLEPGEALRGETSLTILPGHEFRHAAGLITNFHLPRSSLLVLVSAFHGRERTLAAYRRAIAERLRFYSYGDAMVILPEPH